MSGSHSGSKTQQVTYEPSAGYSLNFLMPKMLRTTRQRSLLRILVVFVVILVAIGYFSSHSTKPSLKQKTSFPHFYMSEGDPIPLVNQYIDKGPGEDLARWYIPEEWLKAPSSSSPSSESFEHTDPQNAVEAAQLALQLSVRDGHFIENTNIPLIVHADWYSFDSSKWTLISKQCLETWLEAATGQLFPETPEKFAFILWRHEAIEWFIQKYEPELWPSYQKMPAEVEKSDVFRVLILKWFGGIYGDVDTQPLKHPKFWAKESDVAEWKSQDGLTYGPSEPRQRPYSVPATASDNKPLIQVSSADGQQDSYKSIMESYLPPQGTVPVGAMVGIECDIDPETTRWWRIGYDYPIQLTNWALALAPQHPFSVEYLKFIGRNMDRLEADLSDISPLQLTGPPAFTNVLKHFAEARTVALGSDNYDEIQGKTGFDFFSVTGRFDPPGSRGKVVAGDVMVLPITGISPGRGWKDNMGSLPTSHEEARLYHFFAGRWKKIRLYDEWRKFCRTFLGGCRKPTSFPNHPWNDYPEE